MKALPKDIAETLQAAGYERIVVHPRAVRRPAVDSDGAIRLTDDGKPVIEESEVTDLHLFPGNLRDKDTGDWPALPILKDVFGASFDEASEISNSALRIRNLTLPDVQLQAAE
jgi:hypothetical protein